MSESSASPTPPPKPHLRWFIGAGAFFVGLLTLGLMIATEPKLAMVWDEGYTLGRETRIRLWLEALGDPPGFASRWVSPAIGSELVQPDSPPVPPLRADEIDTTAKLFGPRAMAWFWPFAREEPHGHPPFYAIVGLIGDWVVPGWAQLPRARFGPMLAFSLASGALFGVVATRWGVTAGMLTAAAWVGQPNLFAHGHYATLDGLLASLWVGAVLTFARAVEASGRWRWWGWTLGFGVVCGWAAATKLTGWFVPVPFVIWAIWDWNRRGWQTLLVAGLVGVVILFAFNPCWWNNPVSGVERFLRSNLTRARTIPIPVFFLGQIYQTPGQSLPWYNTLVWTGLVTPVGFLILGMIGAGRAKVDFVRRWVKPSVNRLTVDSFVVLTLMHWGFLLLLRAMPHTPGHDGVRLFLPAFGMLAIVAGYGATQVLAWSRSWGRGIIAASCLEGAVSVGLLMPTPLAYFSPLVGGLPGATALGMEPTYFWDGMTDDAITWLNDHTAQGRSVRFATYPPTWQYLRQTGQLTAPLWRPFSRANPQWFVLQNRPGAWSPSDRATHENSRPAYQVSKFGVPLVWIYPEP